MIETLKKFGLSTKEAKVYLAMIELGTAPVSDIAKKAHINRSTTYVLLQSLAERGLISTSDHSHGRLYTPASPERIVHYLEEMAKKYNGLVGIANSILPELKSMYVGVGPKPKVQFFEGLEGIQTAYEDTLTSNETIRAFASIESMHKTLPHYFPEYYKRRAVKNIHIRAIFPDTPEARERMKHNNEEAREAYLVPKERYSFSQEINVYDNKIVLMALLERFSLIIESPELADALKKMFDLAWEEARRLNDEIQKRAKLNEKQ